MEEQPPPSQRMKYGVNISAQKLSRSTKICRVPGCTTGDLSSGPRYCMRHRICEYHVRCQRVMFDDVPYRFCQKCTRFHVEEEFEAGKHTCREGLLLQRKQRLQRSLNARTLAQPQDSRSTSPSFAFEVPQFDEKKTVETCAELDSILTTKPSMQPTPHCQSHSFSSSENPPLVLGVTLHCTEKHGSNSFGCQQSDVTGMDIS